MNPRFGNYPNGDGSRDGVEDEFVELDNVSNRTLDISGPTKERKTHGAVSLSRVCL
jgi:hypothetical protein